MKKIGVEGFACVNCGETLHSDDLAAVCSDCGAVFCANCVKDGSFKNHECEDCEDD